MNKKERSNFTGTLGFVMAAAGSAVGLGNIWRFPYLAAKDNGGVFILVYIILALTFGFTLLTTDIAIGRKTQQGPLTAYGLIHKKWKWLGGLAWIVPVIILPYYCTIGGWVLKYMTAYFTGQTEAATGDGYFTGFITAQTAPIVFALIFLTATGVSELCNTYGRVDIYTGTLGKAFGGALGGFTTGRKEIIDMLRQSSRPYLFSNSLAPSIIGASLEVFKMLKEDNSIHDRLVENVNYFRDKMMAAGFDIKPTQSAICAVMLYDAPLSQRYANRLLEEGIYVTGFYYPVVPKGEARIRVQLSAGHTREQLDKAIAAFIKIGKELGVLK